MGSSVEVTVQLRETDMCLLHTGFLCSTTEPVTTSPVWTGTGSSIINKVCFQCVVLQDRDRYPQASLADPIGSSALTAHAAQEPRNMELNLMLHKHSATLP